VVKYVRTAESILGKRCTEKITRRNRSPEGSRRFAGKYNQPRKKGSDSLSSLNLSERKKGECTGGDFKSNEFAEMGGVNAVKGTFNKKKRPNRERTG